VLSSSPDATLPGGTAPSIGRDAAERLVHLVIGLVHDVELAVQAEEVRPRRRMQLLLRDLVPTRFHGLASRLLVNKALLFKRFEKAEIEAYNVLFNPQVQGADAGQDKPSLIRPLSVVMGHILRKMKSVHPEEDKRAKLGEKMHPSLLILFRFATAFISAKSEGNGIAVDLEPRDLTQEWKAYKNQFAKKENGVEPPMKGISQWMLKRKAPREHGRTLWEDWSRIGRPIITGGLKDVVVHQLEKLLRNFLVSEGRTRDQRAVDRLMSEIGENLFPFIHELLQDEVTVLLLLQVAASILPIMEYLEVQGQSGELVRKLVNLVMCFLYYNEDVSWKVAQLLAKDSCEKAIDWLTDFGILMATGPLVPFLNVLKKTGRLKNCISKLAQDHKKDDWNAFVYYAAMENVAALATWGVCEVTPSPLPFVRNGLRKAFRHFVIGHGPQP